MNSPPDRYAAALDALNRQIERQERRTREAAEIKLPGWDEYAAALARLEGCRRILQRHAPEWCQAGQHWVCAACIHSEWPDEDWLDASAGVEVR